MINDTPDKATKMLNKDELYRMRHPDRIQATYRKHYAENREKINEKRRLKRQLLKEVITKADDQHSKTESQQYDDFSRAAPCKDCDV